LRNALSSRKHSLGFFGFVIFTPLSTKNNSTMSKHALSYGLLAGLFLIVINLIIYLIDPMLLANWWLGFALLPIAFIALLIVGLRIRKAEGGYLPFGKAFLSVFVAGLVIAVVGTIYQVFLFNVVDPNLAGDLIEQSMENMMVMFERFDLPVDEIEKQMEPAREQMEKQFSIGGQMLGLVYQAFGWAIGALIVAAIVKRNPPVEDKASTFAEI